MSKLILKGRWSAPIFVSGLSTVSPGRFSLIFVIIFFFQSKAFAQVGISYTTITPDASSILELRSTSAGFLSARMTTTQRDAIASPATGLSVYNTDTNQFNYYDGSVWRTVNSGNYLFDPGGNGFVARTALNTSINRILTGTSN